MCKPRPANEVEPKEVSLLGSLATRFGPIFLIPGVLSVLGELNELRNFSAILSAIITNWVAFELVFWASLFEPFANIFDIELQDQFFRGITIPVLWSAFALRLYLFTASGAPTTARGALERRFPNYLIYPLLFMTVYVPASFYIALNIEGMFDGYLAPEPIYPISDGFPLILLTLCSCWALHAASKSVMRRVPTWPTFLFMAYCSLVVLFTAHYMLFLEGALSSLRILGIHNFMEAPALYNLPVWGVSIYFITLAAPIYLVGRVSGKPVLQLTVGVVFILAFDYLAVIAENAYDAL